MLQELATLTSRVQESLNREPRVRFVFFSIYGFSTVGSVI